VSMQFRISKKEEALRGEQFLNIGGSQILIH
jgi:hypothetical protein